MKCQKCGATLQEENIFCTECGYKQLPKLPKVFFVSFLIIVFIYFCPLLFKFIFLNENLQFYMNDHYRTGLKDFLRNLEALCMLQKCYWMGDLLDSFSRFRMSFFELNAVLNIIHCILLFFIIACGCIVPLKRVVWTIIPLYLLEIIYYVISITRSVPYWLYSMCQRENTNMVIMVLPSLIGMGGLLAIVVFRNKIKVQIIVAILSSAMVAILCSIYYQGFCDRVVEILVGYVVGYIAGILLGDILRRNLACQYYIQ